MAKKQENIKETAAAAALPAKSQSVKPVKAPRIQTAKHSKSAVIAESPVAQPELAHEAIATVAYGYWESRGYRGGDALDDWFRAEAELRRITVH